MANSKQQHISAFSLSSVSALGSKMATIALVFRGSEAVIEVPASATIDDLMERACEAHQINNIKLMFAGEALAKGEDIANYGISSSDGDTARVEVMIETINDFAARGEPWACAIVEVSQVIGLSRADLELIPADFARDNPELGDNRPSYFGGVGELLKWVVHDLKKFASDPMSCGHIDVMEMERRFPHGITLEAIGSLGSFYEDVLALQPTLPPPLIKRLMEIGYETLLFHGGKVPFWCSWGCPHNAPGGPPSSWAPLGAPCDSVSPVLDFIQCHPRFMGYRINEAITDFCDSRGIRVILECEDLGCYRHCPDCPDEPLSERDRQALDFGGCAAGGGGF